MRTGRPTDYDPSMIQKVDEYLLECTEWWEEFHKTRGEKSDTYERIAHVKLPMIEGFCEYLDVSKNALYQWAEKYSDFNDALDKIRLKQHNVLADGGVSGRFNPVITKLMLSNNHGYREKSDVTTDGKELPKPLLYVLDNDSNKENSKINKKD